jgi:HKD family nuclease
MWLPPSSSRRCRRATLCCVELSRVQVSVLGQPDANARSIGESVNEALGWPDVAKVWFAVAWAKRSGLTILKPAIMRLRRQGKSVRALIGVDQHGATEEALQLAMRIFSEARVYHDTAPFRTFHPKLYVVEAAGRARVVVGSGNLTEGGLATNYELALQLDVDLRDASDSRVLRDLRNWFDLRWANRDASRKLTASAIARLLGDPTVVVVPEAALPPPPAAGRRQPRSTGSLFGPPVKGLRSAQRQRKTVRPGASDASDAVTPASTRGPVTGTRRSMPPSQPAGYADVVLAAGLPNDRPGQAGFNVSVVTGFFGVSRNGDQILAEGIDRKGSRYGMSPRRLVFPSGSNQNHRIELRDPEGRHRAAGVWPIILVRKLGSRQFEYLYLYPGTWAMRRCNVRSGNGKALAVGGAPKRSAST